VFTVLINMKKYIVVPKGLGLVRNCFGPIPIKIRRHYGGVATTVGILRHHEDDITGNHLFDFLQRVAAQRLAESGNICILLVN
jgi:hypothetical protein